MRLANRVGLLVVLSLASNALAGAATVNVSLNVFPTNLSNPDGGGAWAAVAKTDSPNGIAAINFIVGNISATGIVFESDINQFPGGPYVIAGSPVEFLYAQDTSKPGVVVGVGTLAKSDGPDPLGDSFWNNATLIASGTYGGLRPQFGTKGTNSTAANVLSTASPPFNMSIAAIVTTAVRVAEPPPANGDFDFDNDIDGSDLLIWQRGLGIFGTATKGQGDADGDGTVNASDLAIWQATFGQAFGGGAGAIANTLVPEPTTLILLLLAAVGIALRGRRGTSL